MSSQKTAQNSRKNDHKALKEIGLAFKIQEFDYVLL